jgi:cytoskeletal protein CcmA (bactofilin family)
MSVLARSIKGSEHSVLDPTKDIPNPAPRAAEQHAVVSPPRYAGPSIISAALTVIGGKVDGDISGHVVRIGSAAVVKGTVFGDIVELAGAIDGKIEAKSVVLAKTARMTGDITYQSLQIDQGAAFNGNCCAHQSKTAPKSARDVSKAETCSAAEAEPATLQ